MQKWRIEQEVERINKGWSKSDREELLKSLFGLSYDEKEDEKEAGALASPNEFLNEFAAVLENDGRLIGLKSGFWPVDQMTVGYAPGELILVFGATSRGKSLFTQNTLAYQLITGHKCLYITLEMEPPRLLHRLYYILGDENLSKILDMDVLRTQKRSMMEYQSVRYCVENAKKWGAEICYIDHLHYFPTSGQNQAEELGIITKEMKSIAMEYSIPVVLIAHTRRMVDEWVCPDSTDIRGSSLIEQHADISLAVWQENPEEEEKEHLHVCLKKNRNRARWKRLSDYKFYRKGVRMIIPIYDEFLDKNNNIAGKPQGKPEKEKY